MSLINLCKYFSGGELPKIGVNGISNSRPCKIRTNLLDLKDGSYIFRYKLYENCDKLIINILYNDKHVAESPYQYNSVAAEDCKCPVYGIDDFLKFWQCGTVPEQIKKDFSVFKTIDWNIIRNKVIVTIILNVRIQVHPHFVLNIHLHFFKVLFFKSICKKFKTTYIII